MDVGKSASTSTTLKKLQEDGALPGRENTEMEAGGTNPQPILGRMVAIEDYVLCGFLPPPSEFLLLCPSSRSKWRNRWFYLEIKDSNPVLVVPEEQPNKIPVWTAKPPLTPSLQSFIDIIDDLRERGLSGYEVVADFVAVERHVGQVMISGPTTASDIPAPLCERRATERDEAINASDASPPPPRRQRIVTISEKEARAKAARAKSGGTSSASPASASTDVVPVVGSREATPSGPVSDPAGGRSLPEAVLTCEELQVEMGRLLEAGARGIGREISEARAETAAANTRAERLVRELAEAREDLTKMRELVAGNECQCKGLEDRMSELGNNLSEIRGSLRVTYTGLHQLAEECGIKSTIPANPDEFSLTSSLAELATAMGEIPSKHVARIAEETSNGIYTGACHVLACVRLSRPELDLREILDQGAASNTRKEVMEEVGDLGESVLPLFEEDADDEDVQQRRQPESLAIIPVLEFEPHVSHDVEDRTLDAEVEMATTTSNLEDALATQDRRIQYWKTKFEVAELERTMLVVKKEQAVETLRGREVWFASYLKSCCTSMARVCRDLRVVRGEPKESAAGYISWLNGACAQLDGISKRINEALKQECRRASQYAGGHVLACYEITARIWTSNSSMRVLLVLGGLRRR
uniref:Retrotransposon protein, putative, unclassified n=1 Tax=Oryza sativa subsp. japonica TaxID=39947 RepID=Q2QVR7_ORYSJ|nr:hypothetical protein LOC_Os12g11890 [Oryza sativa Japonica Group]